MANSDGPEGALSVGIDGGVEEGLLEPGQNLWPRGDQEPAWHAAVAQLLAAQNMIIIRSTRPLSWVLSLILPLPRQNEMCQLWPVHTFTLFFKWHSGQCRRTCNFFIGLRNRVLHNPTLDSDDLLLSFQTEF
jgi:hypothetical protein